MSETPLVAVLMGSDSDYEKIEDCFSTLREFEIPFTAHVISAHRTPDLAHEFASTAEEKGYRVVICAAGMAAHLGGVIASKTVLPVIGIPVRGGALQGVDALLSTVQMPPGLPVATVGVSAGKNAAILAAQMLALADPGLTERLRASRKTMAATVAERDERLQKKLEDAS